MKTVSVRIEIKQANKLHEVADQIAGCSINGMVQRAVDLWLEIEGPVYLAALSDARKKLRQMERQPVRLEGVAS